jgi:hypothetical protein
VVDEAVDGRRHGRESSVSQRGDLEEVEAPAVKVGKTFAREVAPRIGPRKAAEVR